MCFRNSLFVFISFLIYFIIFFAYAYTEHFKCDDYEFKISMPIIGFKKAFINENQIWSKIKKFEIDENKLIFYNIKSHNKKCENKKCKINFTIFRNSSSRSFSHYKSIVSNNYCEIDGSNKCFKRKKGKSLQKGYCAMQ